MTPPEVDFRVRANPVQSVSEKQSKDPDDWKGYRNTKRGQPARYQHSRLKAAKAISIVDEINRHLFLAASWQSGRSAAK